MPRPRLLAQSAPGDDLGGLNLTSYTNAFQNTLAGFEFDSTFSSGADGFNIYKRGTSVDIPFALADDSISIFPTDTAGIVPETDTDPFFGIVDTVNGDTSGPITATWVFDISSASADVEVLIDLAAMGDFEDTNATNDLFTFSIGLDGATPTVVGTLLPDVTIDDFEYEYLAAQDQLNPPTSLNDPMQFNGTTLNNVFTTFSLGTIAGSASATSLTLELMGGTDGGSEAIAFRNIVIDESGSGPFDPADLDMDGDVDGVDLSGAFTAFTGPNNGPSTNPAADLDGDGDVDGVDLSAFFTAFTGPIAPASVPEPTSLALLGLGGLIVARRRRG